MPRYFSYEDDIEVDTENLYKPLKLLCGSTASFDRASGISYRCNRCNAVVHSIGMPRSCKELYDMEKVANKLKGKSE